MPRELQLFEQSVKEAAGFLANRERGISIPLARITEAQDLIYNGVYNGRSLKAHEREFLLREALTTADFPYLFGDVLDRQMLASYKDTPPVWQAIVRSSTNNDFKISRRFAITGGDQLLPEVYEKGEYLASDRTEGYFDLQLKKYGRQFDISWESLVNDDMNALKDTPQRFAMAARRTEHRLVSNIFSGDTGGGVAHATSGQLYSTLAGEVNETAALLTIANLEAAVEAMAAFLDVNGEPILNRARYLVVPPSLEMTARQILTSATKMWVELGGAGGPLPYPTNNVIAQYGLELIVDPYLPIVDPVAANGLTCWYLFANPADIAAIEVAHLRGYERPEICMKASDKVAVGGAALDPMGGDFATDNVFYRVRHCFGVTRLDWRATFMGGHAA